MNLKSKDPDLEDNSKTPPATRRSREILNKPRAQTIGYKLPSRPKFVFNEDGTIKGVEDKPIADEADGDVTPKKFGQLSQSLMSGRSPSMMSVVSRVAFSDQNYMPKPG